MLSTEKKMIILGNNIESSFFQTIENETVITFELEVENRLINKKINAIYFHRQAQNQNTWKEILKSAMMWLESWPNLPIYEGKSMIEILRFEDTSIWWFIYDILWEYKNGIFDTIYQLETLISLLNENNPQIIEIHGRFEFKIIEMLHSLKDRYNFKIYDHTENSKPNIRNGKVITTGRINFLLRLSLVKFIHLFTKKKCGQIAIFSIHGGVINKTEKGEKIVADQYFVGLEEIIEKNRKIINFISLNKNLASKNFSEFFELLCNTAKGEFEPWIVYYSLNGFRKAYKISNDFRKKFSEIEKDADFIKSMNIKNVNIYPFVRHLFTGNLSLIVGFTHLEIDAAKRFFAKNDPKLVFTTDGFGAAGRALNYVSNMNKTRSLTPQLGIIAAEFPVNTAFLIRKGYDLKLVPEVLVWGKYFRELIELKGYPQKSIKQVGFWKTDTKKHDEKSGNYIFYIAGANTAKLEYVLSIDEEIYTIRRIHEILPKGIKLLVKLHPSLDDKPYQTLNELENLIIIGNKNPIDVNKLVRNSKIVVGKASTVIIQAMIMKKPIIAVNFAGDVDFLGFKGIPFVKNIEEFVDIMNKYLEKNAEIHYDIKEFCDPIGKDSISLVESELMNG